jgi:hypothetical protein
MMVDLIRFTCGTRCGWLGVAGAQARPFRAYLTPCAACARNHTTTTAPRSCAPTGADIAGLQLSGCSPPSSCFKGLLDVDKLAVMGHSCGGATGGARGAAPGGGGARARARARVCVCVCVCVWLALAAWRQRAGARRHARLRSRQAHIPSKHYACCLRHATRNAPHRTHARARSVQGGCGAGPVVAAAAGQQQRAQGLADERAPAGAGLAGVCVCVCVCGVCVHVFACALVVVGVEGHWRPAHCACWHAWTKLHMHTYTPAHT